MNGIGVIAFFAWYNVGPGVKQIDKVVVDSKNNLFIGFFDDIEALVVNGSDNKRESDHSRQVHPSPMC